MALNHAKSGEIVNLLHSPQASEPVSQALVSVPRLELMRLVLKAGKTVPSHAVAGPITIYCHQGSIKVQVENAWQTMHDNDLMYLEGDAAHALQALSDSVVLVTIFRMPQHQ